MDWTDVGEMFLPGEARDVWLVRLPEGSLVPVGECLWVFRSGPMNMFRLSPLTHPDHIYMFSFCSIPTRGAYRDRHGRGAECGGRGQRSRTALIAGRGLRVS
jgi:hypothetical protein